MDSDRLPMPPNVYVSIHGLFNIDCSTRIGPGHRIKDSLVGKETVTTDTTFKSHGGRKRLVRQWLELLSQKAVCRTFSCSPVNTHVSNVLQPLLELVVEVGQVGKGSSRTKVFLDVPDRRFHLDR